MEIALKKEMVGFKIACSKMDKKKEIHFKRKVLFYIKKEIKFLSTK